MEIYKQFMHYGDILKCDEYFDEISQTYITIKVAKLDGQVALFIVEDGKLQDYRYVKQV